MNEPTDDNGSAAPNAKGAGGEPKGGKGGELTDLDLTSWLDISHEEFADFFDESGKLLTVRQSARSALLAAPPPHHPT